MMIKAKSLIILLSILLVGFTLRVYKLSSLPLYGDELTMVYDSYSLLKTGRDQLGNFLPLNFSMGEGRPAGYVYLSIPFVALFGPGVWGVRALSLLSGLGVIALMYFLGRRLFSERVGLIASFMTAVSPWELALSRGGFESHLALFLALLGTVWFLTSKEKPSLFLGGIFSWGLAVHTYPTYRIVLPLFLLVVIYYLGGVGKILRTYTKSRIIFYLVLFLFFTLTSFQQTFSSSSIDRVKRLGVFSQKELREVLIQKINYERTINALKETSKYFHNKPVEQGFVLISNYLSNYSTEFLFLTGDRNPRHNMAEMGEFYWIEALLILAGFGFLLKKDDRRLIVLLIGWILVSPIASTITGGPHALRGAFLLVPLVLLSSLGLANLLSHNKLAVTKMIGGMVLVVWGIQLILLLERVYFLAPAKHGRFWSEMAKMVSMIAMEKRNDYSAVLLSDKIDNVEYAYQVYAKLDPQDVIDQNRKPIEIRGVKELKKFGNVYIGQFPDTEVFISRLVGRVLYIGDLSEKYSFSQYNKLTAGDEINGLVLYEKR